MDFHPIRLAQHLEKQGMHPVDAMIHSLAHHLATSGQGRIDNMHQPRGRGPINAGGGMIPHAIQGMFNRFHH